MSAHAVSLNEGLSLLTCELRAKLPGLLMSDSSLWDRAQGESWAHTDKNCVVSPYLNMSPGCLTDCCGMSVQEFNDEAERVRKAKQLQISASMLYPIGIKGTVLRSAERTSVQSRREELDYSEMKAQLVHDKQVVTESSCTFDCHCVQASLYTNDNQQADKRSQLRDYVCPGDTAAQMVAKANMIFHGPGKPGSEWAWGTATEKVRTENPRYENKDQMHAWINTPGPTVAWIKCMQLNTFCGFNKYAYDGDPAGCVHPGR